MIKASRILEVKFQSREHVIQDKDVISLQKNEAVDGPNEIKPPI